MSDRGRSPSPKPLRDVDVDMENGANQKGVKVVVVNGLSRNVVQTHLQTIFGFYGEIVKIDLPLYSKCKIIFSIISKFESHIHLFSRPKSRESCTGVR